MTETAIEFLTPVGRLVQGDAFKPRETNYQGQPLIDKQGKPRVEFYIGLAIPKTDPGWPELWQKITTVAQTGFPNGAFNAPGFAWKVIDGDAEGQNTKEGFAGHYIIKMSSGYPPACYTQGGEARITDPAQLKRGYYVRAYGNVKPNPAAPQGGIYINLSMLELIGYGEEIQSGPDGRAVFGSAPGAQLPPGASATPVASAAPMAQPMAPAPGAVAPPPGAPAQPMAPAAPAAVAPPPGAPAQPMAPAPGYQPGAAQPMAPAPGAVAPPPAAAPGAVAPPPGAPAQPGAAVAPNPAFLTPPQ